MSYVIVFSDDNKIIVTDNDIERIVNSATNRLAGRAKHPLVPLYDIDAIAHDATFTYLNAKVKALAQETGNRQMFYMNEMFTKEDYNNVCYLVDNHLTIPMKFE